MFSQNEKRVDCLIVLGAQVRGKKITDSLKRGWIGLFMYLKKYPDTRDVLVSGGQGRERRYLKQTQWQPI